MHFIYVLLGIALTAMCWGSYGTILHHGQAHLGKSPIKALICVGLAYLVIAVIIPSAILAMQGKLWGDWTFSGFSWSFVAGAVGTFGALGIIIAMMNKGKPEYVMPLVFGLAPIVNTIIALTVHKLWDNTGPLFYAGIILVVVGAVTVLIARPRHSPAPAPSVSQAEKEAEEDVAKSEQDEQHSVIKELTGNEEAESK